MILPIPHTIDKPPDNHELGSRDPEVQLIDHLTTRITKEEAKNIDRQLVANIYISLKTKPLLILTGSEGAGKAAVVRVLMETFNDGNQRMKQLVGHPWWVNGNEHSSTFIEAQTRLNSDLLKGMIEEASCEENHRYLYMVCLSRISPGELATFFADIAFQLNHGYLVSLPTLPLPEPVLFPPNFALLATMDSERNDWVDDDLMTQGQIVYMHQRPYEQSKLLFSRLIQPDHGLGEIFISSHIRDHQRAFSKLHRITCRYSGVFAPVLQVTNLFVNQGLQVPNQLLNSAVLYLANAWSNNDIGLFYPSFEDNLLTATDYAIAQNILPYFTRQIQQSSKLAKTLMLALGPLMPYSCQTLRNVQEDPFSSV